MKHKGLNQLLCAAVVNERFGETLLRNPAQAIAAGYCGQSFGLTSEEHDLVIGIQARKLEDFAAKVYGWLSDNGASYDGNGSHSRTNTLLEGVNGRAGWKRSPMLLTEPLFDLVRVPVAA